MFDFDVGYVTDIGNKRKINQDNIMVYRFNGCGLFVVADGMGGMSDGEKASEIVIDNMRKWIEKNEAVVMKASENSLTDILFEEINTINLCILDYCNKKNVKAGTTMTLLLIRDNMGFFAYSGDSRLYRIRGDMTKQLTEDETLYSYNEKNNIPNNIEKNKSILTSYIGKSGNLALNIQSISIHSGDIYILCTDGFYNYLNMYDNDNTLLIRKLCSTEAAKRLTEKVKNTRASDNLSVIIVKLK